MEKNSINLKELRLERGWNQTQAASNLGVSQPTIHRWENDIDEIPKMGIIAIRAVFGKTSKKKP